MDFYWGMLVGAVVIGGVIFIKWLFRTRPNNQMELSSSAHTYSDGDKREFYAELNRKYMQAETRDEHSDLLSELESAKTKLFESNYTEMKGWIESEIKRLDERELARQLAAPQLAAFADLRNVTDEQLLFEELHRINFTEGGVIDYEEVDEFGTPEDRLWLAQTYDQLLIPYFRSLLTEARNGGVDDYEKVMKLWQELEKYTGPKGENRVSFVEQHMAREWNEMIVRFNPNPDYSEDFIGLDEIEPSDFPDIIRKAREEADPLSLWLVFEFSHDQDTFDIAIVDSVLGDLKVNNDAFRASRGFDPEEDEQGEEVA